VLETLEEVMATEDPEKTPLSGRDGLLASINELRALDTASTLPQILEELKNEPAGTFITWQDIITKLQNQVYTVYGMLHQDVQSAISVLGIPDKKRSRLQKTCQKVMKDMKRHWSMTEVTVRMHLYLWHPAGQEKANEVRRAPHVRLQATTCFSSALNTLESRGRACG
jgi:hypothetical protein